MRKIWFGVVALLVTALAGGGYVAYKKLGPASPGAAEAKKKDEKKDGAKPDVTLVLSALDLAQVGPASLAQTLQISGNVDASRQAMVRSRHSGIATNVVKRAGDAVRQGEPLLRVDSEELRLRIGEREASVRQAQAALKVAESARNQQRSLAERGFISRAALDSVESNFVTASTTLENAQSQLTTARTQLAETTVTSPISGVIAKRSIEPGERVGNEAAVFQIIDPSSLEVVVQVPAEKAVELKIGQVASFQLNSASAESNIDAKLNRIVPASSAGGRTVETRFALPAATSIPAGAFLSGKLVLAKRDAALTVPRLAVRSDGNGNYVWIAKDGKAQRTRVKLNDIDSGGDILAVESGLAANTAVLLLRGAEPREGQPVTLPSAVVPGPPAATPAPSTNAKGS